MGKICIDGKSKVIGKRNDVSFPYYTLFVSFKSNKEIMSTKPSPHPLSAVACRNLKSKKTIGESNIRCWR
jgi:hypothetical protein